jgi:hypothetical protein
MSGASFSWVPERQRRSRTLNHLPAKTVKMHTKGSRNASAIASIRLTFSQTNFVPRRAPSWLSGQRAFEMLLTSRG